MPYRVVSASCLSTVTSPAAGGIAGVYTEISPLFCTRGVDVLGASCLYHWAHVQTTVDR